MFVFFGALIGVLAFAPLIFGLKAGKKVTPKSNLGYGAVLILSVFASIIILAAAVAICYFAARDNLLEFALAAAITIVLFAIVFGIYVNIKQTKAAKERKQKAAANKDNKDKE